jgi:hypothetical protein
MKSNSVTRRRFLRTAPTAAAAPILLRSAAWAAAPGRKLQVDVCIYGGVSGGVIAAVALGRWEDRWLSSSRPVILVV